MGSVDDVMQRMLKRIIRDVQVELKDEFDKNFERQAFFAKPWQRRKSPLRPGGAILVDSGSLRRSIKSRAGESNVVFESHHPAAAIHNEGGEIVVTEKMRKFFWYKYYEAQGSLGRKKNGELRRDKYNLRLTTEAVFWRNMALMKKGSTIKMPQRQFIGNAPEVEKVVREIIEENVEKYLNNDCKLQ